MKITAVLLAAGYGTRMKSEYPKVMHPLMGRPMVDWAMRAVESLVDAPPIVVVGHGQELVRSYLRDRAVYAEQQELLGTGHAVLQALPSVAQDADAVIVTYADMPLLTQATLRRLLDLYRTHASSPTLAIAMLTVKRENPQGFGRIVRRSDGSVAAIVEETDCTPEQLAIQELNPGVYCFHAAWLRQNLPYIPRSAKGEYYLTDLVSMAASQGRQIVTLEAPLEDVYGVNNRVHLAEAEAILRRRILERHMLEGVTVVDPLSTYIEDTVQIGADTTIWPGCLLQGATVIGRHCTIGPYSQIIDTQIADHCRVVYSVLEQARMDQGSEIGPFSHLRKGAHLGENVHMGNFGEVKDSYLGPGVKMGHFSYIGNAEVGANVNIGAGTITCNYDGVHKSKTIIGDHAFIGSDTMLVAPVVVGEFARTGAGSVVTRDIPAHATAYGVPARVHKVEDRTPPQGGAEE
ncbi:bifunctional UDP-N-acetylglucosamine diphosphorylase/glucosamine-1-phosphate N-acetyltransferase GlmU [Caldilinea sp.]|jgi:bifunctional UDP-N-acetylglucosamine pyrophosphorylase/glucosamine-1-phosphate N-acetyltransferase|uniref:bifunctional UDP-N-acetylglucosamine diphosphorylase/glucosamine-1-phosphate N-acetyltransferase GlmU n=1 Tax=Caldilinea sp. TaxID=2293560 RepID=UPI0021DE2AB8|nr:bifunctional UDP-N-acetylglucosamine diphosphorylase/glucosamine-1-phosphate N-acetyltransferase GlmU [Caldilinea sp.]GIV70316.1 MAG: bifunctional protein GlmU [Caldilinea sp.]